MEGTGTSDNNLKFKKQEFDVTESGDLFGVTCLN